MAKFAARPGVLPLNTRVTGFSSRPPLARFARVVKKSAIAKAPQAAGVIHSDFERGFIKAETVAYDALVNCGSVAAAREKGLYRMEGKEYVVKDGDVLLFKFNV